MVDRDIVVAKVATIDRCLHRIAEVQAASGKLSPIDIEDITVLNVTRAAQAAIDLATHVVTTEGYGLPDTVASTFVLLAKHGVINETLAERMRKMVGFRNIAVHGYETLDSNVIRAIVGHHLGDVRDFARAVVDKFEQV